MHLKKILPLLIALIGIAGLNEAQAQKASWKEMKEFHDVMSNTFHPAEEDKLEPIRTRSQEMLDKAVAWRASTAPAGFDKTAVQREMKQLVKGATKLNKMVKKNASDADLKEKLTKLHDVFHEIMEKSRVKS